MRGTATLYWPGATLYSSSLGMNLMGVGVEGKVPLDLGAEAAPILLLDWVLGVPAEGGGRGELVVAGAWSGILVVL